MLTQSLHSISSNIVLVAAPVNERCDGHPFPVPPPQDLPVDYYLLIMALLLRPLVRSELNLSASSAVQDQPLA